MLLFLAANAAVAAPVELSRQVITLPANAGTPLFADVEGNGRCHLLVIDPVAKTLFNYLQRPDGFTNSPDQIIPLPPQTAWAALCDVDAHPGLELLFSTATGLVYSRQNDGRFKSERRMLIEVNQKFTSFDLPTLTLLSTNKSGTNDLIPVIAAGQTVLYHRNSAYEWSPGPPPDPRRETNGLAGQRRPVAPAVDVGISSRAQFACSTIFSRQAGSAAGQRAGE
jgi:hypothetical protein